MQGRTFDLSTSEALPFVSIAYTSAGKPKTAASDGNGGYSIDPDPGTTVKFSGIGYGDQIVPADSGIVNVFMRESTTYLPPLVIKPKRNYWPIVLGGVLLLVLLSRKK